MAEMFSRHRPEPRGFLAVHAVASRTALALVIAYSLGIAGTSAAYRLAEKSTSHSHFAVFWVAQIVVLGTVLMIALQQSLPRSGRLLLLTSYALFNLQPKWIMSPHHAVYFDEFGHWRQVQDILTTGQLRPQNAYQPIIRDFPGLELLTAGVHLLTRLSTWHSGQIVIGVAHIAALLLIFGIARECGLSDRWATVSALVYSMNPNFQYFETEFSYESLGLPIALAVILCVLRTRRAHSLTAISAWCVGGCLLASSCAVTHHLSSAFAAGAAVVLAFSFGTTSSEARVAHWQRIAAWIVAAWAVIAVAIWIGVFARDTLDYLEPHIGPAFTQLAVRLGLQSAHVAGGQAPGAATSRTLFAGSLSPSYERYLAFAAPIVVLVAVVATFIGWWKAREWKLARRLTLVIVLSLLYFGSLPFTLTTAGAEGAHRSWSYSYVGIAILAAYGLQALGRAISARRWLPLRPTGMALGLAALVVVAIGDVTVGVNVYYRFPGPYAFGTDTRSLTPETLTTVRWANAHVPAGSHVITDRFTGEAIEGFTDLVTPSPSESIAYRLYQQAGDPSASLRKFLGQHDFSYFILDRRLLTQTPYHAPFLSYRGPSSINAPGLEAFGQSGFGRLVYSSAHYRIYVLATNSPRVSGNLAR